MPNNPPSNLVVAFLVFQVPYIFTKLSGISVPLISEGTSGHVWFLLRNLNDVSQRPMKVCLELDVVTSA